MRQRNTEAGVEAPDKAYLLAVLTEEYMNADDVWDELHTFEWDKKAFMKGRVVNKKARQNVCIADFSQAPDHENKKGTVVDFTQLPVMETLREKLPEEADHMLAEGNFYSGDWLSRRHGASQSDCNGDMSEKAVGLKE